MTDPSPPPRPARLVRVAGSRSPLGVVRYFALDYQGTVWERRPMPHRGDGPMWLPLPPLPAPSASNTPSVAQMFFVAELFHVLDSHGDVWILPAGERAWQASPVTAQETPHVPATPAAQEPT